MYLKVDKFTTLINIYNTYTKVKAASDTTCSFYVISSG